VTPTPNHSNPYGDDARFLGSLTCPYLPGGREMVWDVYAVPASYPARTTARAIAAHYAPNEATAEGVTHRRIVYPEWMTEDERWTVPLPCRLGAKIKAKYEGHHGRP
jgi:hypothetical protein